MVLRGDRLPTNPMGSPQAPAVALRGSAYAGLLAEVMDQSLLCDLELRCRDNEAVVYGEARNLMIAHQHQHCTDNGLALRVHKVPVTLNAASNLPTPPREEGM